MADDAKAEDVFDTLRPQFAACIRDTLRSTPAHVALQLADALLVVQGIALAGMRITYRATREVDGPAIAEAWARGRSIGDIQEQFGCSRATAYKYHPNKSAKPARRG